MRSLGFVCAGLFGLPLLFMAVFPVTIVVGVMLAAPLVVTAWVLVQHGAHRGASHRVAATKRLHAIAFLEIPSFVREAVLLACAGFIGTVAARLVSVDALAAAIDLAAQPECLVLWGLTVLVWAFGQIGFSPITMAVFLGSLVAELPTEALDITLAALAISAGTAVSTAGAPFSSGAVLLARVTGHPPTTLTWRWNGLYILSTFAVLAVIYVALVNL